MPSELETRFGRTRHKILTAAEAIFLKKGFLATSMDEVAAAAGVSKQTVYSHFGSKETLFVEIVEAMAGGASVDHETKLGTTPDNLQLAAFLLKFANEQLSIVMTPRLMQLRRLVIGEVERFPELGQALHRHGPARSINRLATALEFYSMRGELSFKDAHSAASFFNWLVMGAPTNDAMMLGDSGIPSKRRLREHAAESVRIFLAAFTVQ